VRPPACARVGQLRFAPNARLTARRREDNHA
jgi:hypothetical protein